MNDRIGKVQVSVYRIPTPEPEADGTLTWDATTTVTVQVHAAGAIGLGWTYSTAAAGTLVADHLDDAIRGRDPMDVTGAFEAMRRACRNLGTRGLVMQAISAVDVALWDLKAKILSTPLTSLLGAFRESVPVYGSGGFTTYSPEQLDAQIQGWAEAGCTAMKIKIGQDWGNDIGRDVTRVRQLVSTAGPTVQAMVDANGGYNLGQARRVGHEIDQLGVVWFEEPVSSDNLSGLRLLRDVLSCDVAAGEYVSECEEAFALCDVVDCLQLDATRCGGYTGFLRSAEVARARHLQVSAHCAPALHAPVAAAVPHLRHVEWFADHARFEPELFVGVPPVQGGALQLAGRGDPGHGMGISDRASCYRV